MSDLSVDGKDVSDVVLTLQQAAIDAFILEEVERRACRSDCDQGVLGAQCRARLA